MKRTLMKGFFIILLLSMVFTAGCGKQSTQPSQGESNEKKLKVYASFYPMYDFASFIGRDKVDVTIMVPPGVEAHDWDPTAKLMTEIETADVFIYNGLGMEPWVDKLLGSINHENLVVLETSKGTNLLQSNPGEEEEGHEEELHGAYDPHVWLDPLNALKQAENIKNVFIQVDEDNKDFYEANYQEFSQKIRSLDSKFKQELSNVARKEIIVAHAAFGYLTHRYGLEQVAITGISSQAEPSAAKMSQITEFIKEYDIKYIFFETLTSPRLAEVLATETGVETAVLNPIEGLTQQEVMEGKNYLSVMEENLSALKKALVQ